MTKLKKGDRCEIIAIGKMDSFYGDRKELIGRKFRFLKQHPWGSGGGFVGCDLKPETKMPGSSISETTMVGFYRVKLKKI